jgi:flagellar biosynthesis protein FlhA
MLVSKGGVEGTADKALFAQLSAYPTAMGLSSGLLGVLALFPGIPLIPFLGLSGLTGYAAWRMSEKQDAQKAKEHIENQVKEAQIHAQSEQTKASIQTGIMPLDSLKVEIGYDLLSLISEKDGQKLTKQIKSLREQMANDLGFMLPPVRIHDNLQLEGKTYIIKVKEMEVGRGDVMINKILVIDPYANPITLEGTDTIEPTFGLNARWIDPALEEEAERLGYTLVEPVMVISTHLGELVKENISDLLSFEEVQKLLDHMSEPYKKLLNDIVPGQISVAGIQRVLQNLVKESISIRDLTGILEGIAEAVSFTRNVTVMTEHVRSRLARQITLSHVDENHELNIITMSSEWEKIFHDSLIGDGEIKQLAIAPSDLQQFIHQFNETYERFEALGTSGVFVVHPTLRPYILSIFERVAPKVVLLSQNEVFSKVKINTLASI